MLSFVFKFSTPNKSFGICHTVFTTESATPDQVFGQPAELNLDNKKKPHELPINNQWEILHDNFEP